MCLFGWGRGGWDRAEGSAYLDASVSKFCVKNDQAARALDVVARSTIDRSWFLTCPPKRAHWKVSSCTAASVEDARATSASRFSSGCSDELYRALTVSHPAFPPFLTASRRTIGRRSVE